MELSLPEIRCTEDAVAFGQHITRDQFIFLSGARMALQREFAVLDYDIRNLPEESMAEVQLRADLAFKIQMIREALEVAPDPVLMSIIGTGLGVDHEHEHEGRCMAATGV